MSWLGGEAVVQISPFYAHFTMTVIMIWVQLGLCWIKAIIQDLNTWNTDLWLKVTICAENIAHSNIGPCLCNSSSKVTEDSNLNFKKIIQGWFKCSSIHLIFCSLNIPHQYSVVVEQGCFWRWVTMLDEALKDFSASISAHKCLPPSHRKHSYQIEIDACCLCWMCY